MAHWTMAKCAVWLKRKFTAATAARRGLCACLTVTTLLFGPLVSRAGAGEELPPEGRHRLDVSVSSLDATEGDAYTALAGYSLTLNDEFRLGLRSNYTFIHSESSFIDSDSGPGDTDLLLQWDPSRSITSSPWIPDSLGFTLNLTIPTGDAGALLGGDQFVGGIGVGWVAKVLGNLHVLPSAAYSRSFAEGSKAAGLELADLGLSLIWITPSGFWMGYTPFLQRDLDQHTWTDEHGVVVGKMWLNRYGVSLAYGRRNRLDPTARRDDYTAFFSFYYQFGRPN